MNKEAENRREFLRRASLAAVALPFLLNCKSDTLAQKSDADILSILKKNAATPGAEGSPLTGDPAAASVTYNGQSCKG